MTATEITTTTAPMSKANAEQIATNLRQKGYVVVIRKVRHLENTYRVVGRQVMFTEGKADAVV